MGLQISYCVYSQIQEKEALRENTKAFGKFFHELAKYKESKIIEGHICPDHVHMCISIPPKYAVSNVIGYIKGKSAISIARNLMGLKRNFTGQQFWACGYLVSTIGLDEQVIVSYIKNQEKVDLENDQLTIHDEPEK